MGGFDLPTSPLGPRAGPCGRVASLISFHHSTARAATGGTIGGPCGLPLLRRGRLCAVPGLRTVQPAPTDIGSQLIQPEHHGHWPKRFESDARGVINENRGQTAGACLAPSIVWLVRAVKVVFRRPVVSGDDWPPARRNLHLDRAHSAMRVRLGRHAGNAHAPVCNAPNGAATAGSPADRWECRSQIMRPQLALAGINGGKTIGLSSVGSVPLAASYSSKDGSSIRAFRAYARCTALLLCPSAS